MLTPASLPTLAAVSAAYEFPKSSRPYNHTLDRTSSAVAAAVALNDKFAAEADDVDGVPQQYILAAGDQMNYDAATLYVDDRGSVHYNAPNCANETYEVDDSTISSPC